MLTRFTTFDRLYMLIFITAASLIGLGLYGIDDLKIMNDNTRSLYADRVLCMQQLANVRFEYSGNILPLPLRVKNKQLTFKEAENRLQQAQKVININWHDYKLTYLTPEEARLVKQTDVLKNQADDAVENLGSILAREDTTAINGLIQGGFSRQLGQIVVKVTQLIDLQVRAGKDVYDNNAELYDFTSKKFILLIFLSLFIALSLSFYIIKNIKGLIKEILKSNNIIKESEEKYRSLLEHASDAIYLIDERGNFTEVNESMCKMTGYTREELLQLRIQEIIDPDQFKTAPLIDWKDVPNQSLIKERRFIRKQGDIFDVELNAKKLADSRVLVIARDITDRKQIETALREAEVRFRTLAEKSMVGIYIIQKGKALYLNPRFAEIFGYEQHELMDFQGSIVDIIVSAGDRGLVRKNIDSRYSGELENIHYEFNGQKKNGAGNRIELFGSRVIIDGQPSIIGTMIDVTDRELAQELILKEKALSEAAINSMPGIFYVRNEEGKFLRWNKNMETITGYSAQEIEKLKVRDMIAREDFEILDKAAEKVFKDGYSMAEAKVKMKDGSKVPFLLTGSPITYQDQLCLLGTGINISSRVKAENELRLSKANLLTILNTTDTAYALFDMELKVLAFNQNATEFVKSQFNHVPQTGDLLADYFPPNRFPQFINFAGDVLNGNNINYEIDYPQADGSIRWYYVRLFPITNDSKEILGLMLALSDITERKNAEQDLKSAYERIQNQINSIKDMAWKQSHLIRSPLANLKGLAAMLRDDPSDTDVLNFIQSELDRLDLVIIDMAEDASRHS